MNRGEGEESGAHHILAWQEVVQKHLRRAYQLRIDEFEAVFNTF